MILMKIVYKNSFKDYLLCNQFFKFLKINIQFLQIQELMWNQNAPKQQNAQTQKEMKQTKIKHEKEVNDLSSAADTQKSSSNDNQFDLKLEQELQNTDKIGHKNQDKSKQQQLEVLQDVNNNTIETEKKLIEGENDPTQNLSITYRRDIDGIRAIAILLVLIYHVFPKKLTGGFIGVDVFFVISGFLITQIIVKQALKKKFSILNFYCRRIKRIYPALILVLCFALWIISKFTQIDLVNFSLGTLDSALIFCANLRILAHKQDYFDADIRGNPLLHLWSLGVEEQFYIIWPFLILLTLRYAQKSTTKILAMFTICSFVFSIVSVYQNAKFAFYFPLARFWQMSVGGLLGYADFRFRSQLINNVLSIVGLLAILMTAFVINDESLFPGFWTLLPTLGCASIIQARNESFISKYILSSKPMTFIGKISYSLYLWHWPLIVYSRIFYPFGSKSIFSNMYFIVGLAVGISIVAYFLVERPVRKIKRKKIVIFLLALMGCIGIASTYVGKKASDKYYSQDGIELIQFFNKVNRQMAPEEQDYVTINGKRQPNFSYNKNRQPPTDINQIRAQIIQLEYEQAHPGLLLLQKSAHESLYYKGVYETLGNGWLYEFAVANEGQENHLLLIGDSHIEKISYRFQELFRKSQIKGTLDTFPTVMAVVKRGLIMGEQNPILNFTRTLIQMHKPKRILFGWNWIYYFCKDTKSPMNVPANCDQQLAKTHIPQFINFLLEIQAQGIEVYTIGVDINHIQYSPENMLDADGFIEENLKPFRYSDFRRKYQFVYDLVQGAMNQAKINWIDVANNLCWEDWCHVVSPKGYAGFSDIDHMGKYLSSNWVTIYDHLVEF